MADSNIIGYQIFSADGALGTSGQAMAVYGINIVSTGGGGGVVILRNGTSASDTAVIQENGTTSLGKSFVYAVGVTFPSGCFVDVDANVSQATIFYSKV